MEILIATDKYYAAARKGDGKAAMELCFYRARKNYEYETDWFLRELMTPRKTSER